ncbi:unnamed protein product [Adineta steineri]|uniref:Uncharacterized protein n=1 Tax=Adineta steineri TaxID=433720 RepID=A0A813QWL6_9BILA|nr:unnamed protein product [Adineta steineri]CAF3583970.1 unnamed protein product [Adineta steineri]
MKYFFLFQGASTLANKANRFNEKPPTETPGPGYYELHANQSPRLPIPDIVKHQRQNVLKINRKSLPPSIPDPKYSYGFEQDEDGNLVPHQPVFLDQDIDQDFSNTTVENDPTKLYQGVHFGKYSSKRTDFAAKPGPGPGEYDVHDPIKLEIHHINAKPIEKRSELQVPRYPDSLLKTAAKDDIPGPGQYSIKRELDFEQSKSDILGLDIERPPFGSQTQRFNNFATAVPGPGAYDDKFLSIFNSSQTKPTSIKRVPFNQTTARFVSTNYKSRSLPGPAQYHIPTFTDENTRRVAMDHGKKPPFNVAAVRRFNILPKDETNRPGPSTYDVKTQPSKPKYEQPTANFISNTSRDLVIEDIPGPAAYDVPSAYQSLITQHRKSPRSKVARQRQSQFLSAAKRTFVSDMTTDNPGPGAYEGSITSRPHGYAPVRDTRFRDEIPQLPGPADYELSPLLQDTVLRGTFNTKLNNPILVKLQNRALKEEAAANAMA